MSSQAVATESIKAAAKSIFVDLVMMAGGVRSTNLIIIINISFRCANISQLGVLGFWGFGVLRIPR